MVTEVYFYGNLFLFTSIKKFCLSTNHRFVPKDIFSYKSRLISKLTNERQQLRKVGLAKQLQDTIGFFMVIILNNCGAKHFFIAVQNTKA